jgi:sporulation protein YlmC with PRC-barrel domain
MRRILSVALAVAVLAFANPATSSAQIAGSVKVPTDQGTLQAIALGYRASKMLKTSVYDLNGKKIGTVDDIIFAPSRGASFFIIDVGGFLGIGSKTVAIPAGDFKIIDKKVVLPGVTAAELKSLPAFTYSSL